MSDSLQVPLLLVFYSGQWPTGLQHASELAEKPGGGLQEGTWIFSMDIIFDGRNLRRSKIEGLRFQDLFEVESSSSTSGREQALILNSKT